MRCNIHDFDIMEEGKELGRSEAKLEATRNMLLKHIGTIDQVSEIIGLPLEKVRELAEEIKEKV
ncbi:MAG: hypothetical protein J5631_00425 [Spirochaetaceae bacterium]|nr:hypothetical protein [Spirochaetaceae bacterium]